MLLFRKSILKPTDPACLKWHQGLAHSLSILTMKYTPCMLEGTCPVQILRILHEMGMTIEFIRKDQYLHQVLLCSQDPGVLEWMTEIGYTMEDCRQYKNYAVVLAARRGNTNFLKWAKRLGFTAEELRPLLSTMGDLRHAGAIEWVDDLLGRRRRSD